MTAALKYWRELFLHHYAGVAESLLATQVQSAWSAFEVLATDLWVEAVNRRPGTLVKNFLAKQNERAQEKSIPISVLSRYGHDLTSCMGTMLRDQGKVDFKSLTSIRADYERTFGPAVKPSIAGPDLLLLESTRNLLAHRSGIVDDRFLQAVGSSTLYKGLASGIALPLDGDAAATLTSAAVDCGVALATFVDQWLIDHPA
jgi:hypothetical protein